MQCHQILQHVLMAAVEDEGGDGDGGMQLAPLVAAFVRTVAVGYRMLRGSPAGISPVRNAARA